MTKMRLTIDPIAEMSEIALRHEIPMHVDACVGGFILPFMAMNGRDIPVFDFSAPASHRCRRI